MFTCRKRIFCQQPIEFDEREKASVQPSRNKLIDLLTAGDFINK